MNTLSLHGSKIRASLRAHFRQHIDKKAVLADIVEDGTFTYHFALFSVLGCAIATLGLLLNSPAVIIGAMLISPLMGPIVLQGFSLGMINLPRLRQSTLTLFIGASLAIAISFLIVFLSPITEVNSEILARVSPNLFDLLIAVCSGLAAGYTSIRRKGSALVGVAIATALMPPLAVTGFGLATGHFWISEGAFFLFMTNLLAISLSVSVVSKLYGFGYQKDSRYLLGQAGLTLVVLAILGIPLGISLKNIAFQAYAASKAKGIIQSHFTGKLSRLNEFNISIDKNTFGVDAVVITKTYNPKVKESIRKELEDSFQRPVDLNLVQIALTKDEDINAVESRVKVGNNLVGSGSSLNERVNAHEDFKNHLSKSIWFPHTFIHIDNEQRNVQIFASSDPSISLRSLRDSEEALARQFPEWTFLVYPPQNHLPSLYFDPSQFQLNEQGVKQLEDVMWALKRWDIRDVDIIGYASTTGKEVSNAKLAHQRSQAIANILKEDGFVVHVRGRYLTQNQREKEKYKGLGSYQRVDLRPHYDTQRRE